MKYGLFYFKNTHNIGDDIWAYAQSLFYPHIDYLIDNTTVYKFKAENDEDVATIIGAFVEPRNHEYAFLPPSNIIPFFIGAYFRSTMWEFLKNEPVIRYLKAFAPIGTRTAANAARLAELGIDANYSGCITLTLPEIKKNKKNYICLVDVPDYVKDFVEGKVGNDFQVKVMTHDLPKLGMEIYLAHRELSVEERFGKVREMLQIYADAHCVITSKLHCAIPCLTQHTPVLFTLPRNGDGIVDMYDRMGCYFELFNMCWYDDFLKKSVDYDFLSPPANPELYMSYRLSLQEKINAFISGCEEGSVSRKEVFTEKERIEITANILENKIVQLKDVVDYKNVVINEKIGGILKLQQKLRKYEAFNEWENVEFFRDWSDRSEKLSKFISDVSDSVLDLGCGEMHIKKYLREGCRYYGCDYKKRDENTIICDLAAGEFPLIDVYTIFMAGVMEYLTNWRDVLKNASEHCEQIVMSYSTSEEAKERDPRWVNNISETEIIQYLENLDFELKEREKVTFNSLGFNFVRRHNLKEDMDIKNGSGVTWNE